MGKIDTENVKVRIKKNKINEKTTYTKIQTELIVPDLKGGDNKSTNDNVDKNDHTK